MAKQKRTTSRRATCSTPVSNFVGPIALLGTSADPPTYGHKALLTGLLTIFPKVVTWASNNPTKNHGESLQNRHALLNALVEEIANPHLQLVQNLSSPWTIKTLNKASNLWPGEELVFVVGSDLAEQIPTWEEPKAVMKKARIGIAPREGWPLQEKHFTHLESLGARIDLLPLKIPYSASSQVRNNPHPSEIPDAILPIMLENNLYGLTNKK